MNEDRCGMCLRLLGLVLIAMGLPGVGMASPRQGEASPRYQVAGVVRAAPASVSETSPVPPRFSVAGTVRSDSNDRALTSRFQIKGLNAALATCAAPADAVFTDGFE